jgi:hypothetical protein
MNRDDIIRMAREAGLYQIVRYCDNGGYIAQHPPFDMLERFFHMAQAAEREACAKVCDEIRHPWGYSAETPEWCRGTEHCANAIRARGQA